MKYSLANLPMKKYLIAASSPLTESVERVVCCEAAGFSAAILKSCADYHCSGIGYGRKIVYVDDGYYADASFENKILTLKEEIALYSGTRSETSGEMIIISSVSASSLNPTEWIESCMCFQELGAKLIQLDFFYLGTFQHDDDFYNDLGIMLTKLGHCNSVYYMDPLLKHNPWCDYLLRVNCDCCGGCTGHLIP